MLEVEEVILGGELVVSEEFVEGAVELIGTAFDDHLQDGTAVLSVFGGVGRGLHAELFEGIDRWGEGGGVDAGFGGDDAVESHLLVDFALAVGADGNAVSGDGEAAGTIEAHADAELNAGDEDGEGGDVAAVEREFNDAFVIDIAADGGVFGFEGGAGGGDFDDFRCLTDLELEIDTGLLLELDGDVLLLFGFESRGGDADRVFADIDEGEGEVAFAIGDGLTGGAGTASAEGDFGAGNGGARGVGDGAEDFGGRRLGIGDVVDQQQEQRNVGEFH